MSSTLEEIIHLSSSKKRPVTLGISREGVEIHGMVLPIVASSSLLDTSNNQQRMVASVWFPFTMS